MSFAIRLVYSGKSVDSPFFLAMLAIALPKLVNLRRVSFAGSNEVASKFAEVLASSHPYLGGLTLQ